ncbi:hypothetical protein EJ08DRAFT_480549 [Tothia fuscella]|uniref:Uncharacterized protein n=1 Tax=Tothia fuscella TaxID=1048955 RepID=A0A9P4TTG5_9PEZI|nr:hypothetical protein EJ08DRAFT_480549 [Tothia fuscella]
MSTIRIYLRWPKTKERLCSEVFHASALWDKVRIIKKLTAAEDKYREATRKLRAMGRCPTTIDSTHVSNPTTDIDIGDAALLYHQPRFRAKVDAWKAKVPRFEPQHYTYTDRHYVRSPVLFPLDSPKGELSEIPQLYDWDCKSVPIGQCLSDPGTKEAAAQIRAWKRLQRDAAKQLVGTPKRERSQSQSDSSSRKKRKEGDGMITFPANFKYPVFTYQGSAVQPVTSKPPP